MATRKLTHYQTTFSGWLEFFYSTFKQKPKTFYLLKHLTAIRQIYC